MNHVPIEWINKIFQIIHDCNWHTFILLTKRPIRMKQYLDTVFGWPFPNVWVGCTVCNQEEADAKIPILLQIPAAVIWISHEPALEKITYPKEFLKRGNRAWLITGGETGPGARPMHPDIPRYDRNQCVSAGIPYFFKQWGEWTAEPGWYLPDKFGSSYKSIIVDKDKLDKTGISMGRVGKKKAGRLLDGKEWDQYPEIL